MKSQIHKHQTETKMNVCTRALTILTLLVTLTTTYSFASPAKPTDEISGEIRNSFQRNFQHAEILNTEAHKMFTRLTFKMDAVIMSAFYSDGGELLAVTHNIVSTQLPVDLLMGLKNNYSGFWITELFELNGDDQSCFYVSLESGDSKVTLRSNGDSWEVYSSVKK